MGSKPTHPELLDWLAVQVGGENSGSGKDENNDIPPSELHPPNLQSLKGLHRLIVTSATYRQSSQNNEHNAAIDGDNRFLWRMNRTRLDAESVRDALIVTTGLLDRRMGGESVKQFIQTPGIHVTPNVDYANFDPDRPENVRRSVYRFIFRTLPDPLMETLDFADSSQLTAVRNSSVAAVRRWRCSIIRLWSAKANTSPREPSELVRIWNGKSPPLLELFGNVTRRLASGRC